MKPTVHLICTAHLDPVWQWRWEEGAAEALATFGTAADILDEHPDLIFCHNEAVLYQWVEEHDPPLFRRITKLVRAGRWAVSGGWYLQPDANLPGLESLVRQIAEGRLYFREKFGAAPVVAYNFDSFGHCGGLPQVLKQAGYEMYIHMRPQAERTRSSVRSLSLARRGRNGDPGLSDRRRALPHRARQHRAEARRRNGAGPEARPGCPRFLGYRRPWRRGDARGPAQNRRIRPRGKAR